MVKRGQDIDLFIKTRSYEIHSSGKALSDGARGDVIRVKNSRSSKIVEGTIVGPGIVQIGHQASP
ncbi:MAG: flagellar basal body P-ring formation chaperone FlgA, partial [Gammaproteobacteria bacterium]|nr:flagellar basal body P-ring formation chaperone FlgA [Gammaproteobacteria bacterium]